MYKNDVLFLLGNKICKNMVDFIEYVWFLFINNWKIGFGGNVGFFFVIYINSMLIVFV